MSKWDEAHTEPMHDHPAEKDQLVAAMEAAGYTLDTLESTGDNLRFYGAAGNIITMGGWHECEEWLNGVVFDDPQVSDRVEIILHPERFPERDASIPPTSLPMIFSFRSGFFRKAVFLAFPYGHSEKRHLRYRKSGW